jgi:hypothetical protein
VAELEAIRRGFYQAIVVTIITTSLFLIPIISSNVQAQNIVFSVETDNNTYFWNIHGVGINIALTISKEILVKGFGVPMVNITNPNGVVYAPYLFGVGESDDHYILHYEFGFGYNNEKNVALGAYKVVATYRDFKSETAFLLESLPLQHVLFDPSWHYTGNESLSGTIANRLCSIPPTPCAQSPVFSAEKFVNDAGAAAYLVTRSAGSTDSTGHVIMERYDIVVVNSSIYCIFTTSKVPEPSLNGYPRCSTEISTIAPVPEFGSSIAGLVMAAAAVGVMTAGIFAERKLNYGRV